MLSSGNYYCCISLSLKMIRRCKCRPLIEIYSMIVVHSHWPGSFLKILRFSIILNIRLLALIPYIRPVSSIFYRSAYIIFLIIGRSKNRNHIYIVSTIVLLIRTVSIQQVWRVLTYRLRCKKFSN